MDFTLNVHGSVYRCAPYRQRCVGINMQWILWVKISDSDIFNLNENARPYAFHGGESSRFRKAQALEGGNLHAAGIVKEGKSRVNQAKPLVNDQSRCFMDTIDIRWNEGCVFLSARFPWSSPCGCIHRLYCEKGDRGRGCPTNDLQLAGPFPQSWNKMSSHSSQLLRG